MLTIDLRGSKKTMDEIMEEYAVAVSREIILSICKAIDHGSPRVTCAVFLTDTEDFYFDASQSFYTHALQANISTLIKIEEYETCALAVKYIKRLNSKLLRKENCLEN